MLRLAKLGSKKNRWESRNCERLNCVHGSVSPTLRAEHIRSAPDWSGAAAGGRRLDVAGDGLLSRSAAGREFIPPLVSNSSMSLARMMMIGLLLHVFYQGKSRIFSFLNAQRYVVRVCECLLPFGGWSCPPLAQNLNELLFLFLSSLVAHVKTRFHFDLLMTQSWMIRFHWVSWQLHTPGCMWEAGRRPVRRVKRWRGKVRVWGGCPLVYCS